MAAWIEVTPCQDVLGVEQSDQQIPADSRHLGVEFENDVLVIVALGLLVGEQLDAGNAVQA